MTTKLTVLICGGGNGAHVMAGIAANEPLVESRILSLYADEAERWNAAMADETFVVHIHMTPTESTKVMITQPFMVTKDPATATEGVDIIVFVLPAFAHTQYLEALKPYIKPGMILVGLPGQAGFEFPIRGVLGDISKQITLMNFESLPWACRIKTFGTEAEVLGTKHSLQGAMQVGSVAPPGDPVELLQRTLGKKPVLKCHGHLLGMTLMGVNGYIHPSILYGQWHDWDGAPLDPPAPLFYHGMNEWSAKTLDNISMELMNLAQEIMKRYPSVDLTNTVHIYDWYMNCYAPEIADKSTLLTAIRTNSAYEGLTHPTKTTAEGKIMPNFEYRYITEDIPYGLVVLRGIAEVAGVPTPYMDKLLKWAERVSKKEYLVNGQIKGKDVKNSRSAQKYGLTTLEAILGL